MLEQTMENALIAARLIPARFHPAPPGHWSGRRSNAGLNARWFHDALDELGEWFARLGRQIKDIRKSPQTLEGELEGRESVEEPLQIQAQDFREIQTREKGIIDGYMSGNTLGGGRVVAIWLQILIVSNSMDI